MWFNFLVCHWWIASLCQVHVAHGEAAKAMQAYIRKIEEEAPEDESMEIQEGEQGGQQTITITAEDGGEEQTVYQMSDGTYQAVVTDASHVSCLLVSPDPKHRSKSPW